MILDKVKNKMHSEHYNRYIFTAGFISGKKVLDAACGEGGGSFLMSEKAKEVIGVDLRGEAIQFAKNNYKGNNVDFIVGDVTKLPFKDNFFDVAVSFETVEHISENDQKKFLAELKRVVRSDGLLIISTPDKRSWRKLGLKWDDHICELDFHEFDSLLKKYFLAKEYFKQGVIVSDVPAVKVIARYALNFIKNLDFLNLRHKIFIKEIRSNLDNLTKLVDTTPEITRLDPLKEIAVTMIAICENKK